MFYRYQKGYLEDVILGRINSTKGKKKKRQAIIDKPLHRKQKVEQHDIHYKLGSVPVL